MKKWEYQITYKLESISLVFDIVKFLNEEGKCGWELVSHNISGSTSIRHDFIFKRKTI